MYKTLLENQPYAMALFDNKGKCLFFNKKELEFRNIKEKEIRHLFDNFDQNEVFLLKRCLSFAQNKKKEVFFEYERNEMSYQLRMIEDDKENLLTTSRNISKEKILEKEVKEEKENIKRFTDAIKGANIGFWDFFPQEDKIFVNETWLTQKKYDSVAFRKNDDIFSELNNGLDFVLSLIHPEDIEKTKALISRHLKGESNLYEAEFRIKCADGTWKWIYDLGKVFQVDDEGSSLRMNGVHIDITNIKELQLTLQDRSEELILSNKKLKISIAEVQNLKEEYEIKSKLDALTMVYNKDYFMELAFTQLEIANRYKQTLSLLFLDLDYFKKINDNYGHLVGDEVLKEVVKRVNSCIRNSDIFARFGGEEFILLLPCTAHDDAFLLAERIRVCICSKPIKINNLKISISTSIGLSSNINNDTLEDLIKKADHALYKAKKNGRNTTKVY